MLFFFLPASGFPFALYFALPQWDSLANAKHLDCIRDKYTPYHLPPEEGTAFHQAQCGRESSKLKSCKAS